ncbi:Superfamily II DNA or RNA helicase, SNF2 family [Desulfatibacillum alkenivorans DSM 16219]|jgi:SNF2 family DNA or RNA helicase|uniref:Superfamily II DNA or RNA helicase, SNF2 family n=1 Tax=Desulfatibacillum alkenivorans DSM 16219 TaxID=1121393 RepID=A0A1M6NVW0_9BACT|nr:SNF2-related protein [Desulfatibacillum alkenivorans]SHJ99771.1 Superfamily II DNA or RNA helicase, SNF2 family [Desulfatibacillum alkenivorans DSM 16219]
MGILDAIRSLRHQSKSSFEVRPDSKSLLFSLSKDQFDECLDGKAEPFVTHQFVALKMLEEQGAAEQLANGFRVFAADAVCLDQENRELLGLPEPWPGSFDVNFIAQTTRSGFEIQCSLCFLDGAKTRQYSLNGPMLRLSEQETYLPDHAQWTILDAVKWHHDLPGEKRTEYNNLLAVHLLQEAKKEGARIQLAHFEDLETAVPGSVGVAGRLADNGDLFLLPSFENLGAEEMDIEKRLGQLSDNPVASFRVKNKIVLLDESRFNAAREIIEHRRIPKEQVQQFLETPSAYLDASLVNLELGFSFRMHGATEFKHAYFGRTDAASIEWFQLIEQPKERPAETPSKLERVIKELDDVYAFRERMEDARHAGAETFPFNEYEFSLSESAKLEAELKEIETQFETNREETHEQHEEDKEVLSKDKPALLTTDIDTHDEALPECLSDGTNIDFSPWAQPIDWSIVKRSPYPHQEQGVRWLLGHMDGALRHPRPESGVRGCLLADDMGLGKTYMTLVAMALFLKMRKDLWLSTGPVLVVAPSILLDVWNQEVEATFHQSPFRDIVTLQGKELSKFKSAKGNEIHGDGGDVRYCLKVGGRDYPIDRLDMPNRLVLTTYDTLRNYQFSMCSVDWSMVVFDEAQAIKNPNSLQTRAAKGLRSGFNLLVTGTPVENDLRDFWCLFDTAFPGYLRAYQDFRKQYMAPICNAPPDNVGQTREQVGKELREHVGEFMLRRTKEENLKGLPEKRIRLGAPVPSVSSSQIKVKHAPNLECMMEGRQRLLYDSIITATLDAQNGGQKGAALKGLHQLRDVSLHSGIMDGGVLPEPEKVLDIQAGKGESAKLARLLLLIDEIRDRNEKVIIFLINRRLQRYLSTVLQMKYHLPVDIINGETKGQGTGRDPKTRHTMIAKFQAQKGFGVLIMSPLAAGVGLTVTAANNVIHFQRHWNPAKEDQATDRVYRIGQERVVNVYIPVAHHPEMPSFEVNLNTLLSRKTDLKDAVVTCPDVSPDQIYAQGIFGHSASIPKQEPLGMEDVHEMPWAHFEALAAELAVRAFDAEAWLTPASGDRGCDVVVMSANHGNMLIQCKHSGKGAVSGEMASREVHSSKPFYEEMAGCKFQRLIVCTNVKKISAKENEIKKIYGVEFWNGGAIKKLLAKNPIRQSDILSRLYADRFTEKA